MKPSTLSKVLWAAIVGLCMLAICFSPSLARAEGYIAAGKTTPVKGARPVGVVSIGRRTHKYDIAATYVSEAVMYSGTVRSPRFAMLSVSRAFEFQTVPFLRGYPTALVGLSFKGSDRCAHNGESDCDRRMPLPVNFHFGLGVTWQQFRIELYHDSNNATDYGPEKKNLGLNWLSLVYRLR